MNNGISLLHKLFEKFNSELVLNNNSISEVKYYQVIDPDYSDEMQPDCLYITEIKSNSDCSILENAANFLIITDIHIRISVFVNSKSNALIIRETTSNDILPIVETFFAAKKDFDAYSSYLLKSILNYTNLSDVLLTAEKIVNNPVMLFNLTDTHIQALEYSNRQKTPDFLWNALMSKRSMELFSGNQETLKSNENLIVGMRQKNSAFLFEYPNLNRRISSSFNIGNSTYVLQILELDKHFEEKDFVLCEMLKRVVFYMMNKNNSSVLLNNTPTTFFRNVVDGIIVNDAQITLNAKNSGINLGKKNYLFLIRSCSEQILYYDVTNFVKEIKLRFPEANVFLYENYIITIFYSNESTYSPNEKIIKYLKKYDNKWESALSLPFSHASRLGIAYKQCLTAIHFSKQLQTNSRFYDYKNFVNYNLIYKVPNKEDLDLLCLDLAYDIVNYDRENQQEYADTLLLYVRNLRSVNAVAEKMHIHKNTVTYRLRRLAELFSVDLEDAMLLNTLALSFEIIKFIKS